MRRKQNTSDGRKVRGRDLQFVGLFVKPEMRAALEAWAKEEDRTLSNLITHLISLDVERRSPARAHNATIEDVLAQVDVLRETIVNLLSQRQK